jgi:hypothetical protein
MLFGQWVPLISNKDSVDPGMLIILNSDSIIKNILRHKKRTL